MSSILEEVNFPNLTVEVKQNWQVMTESVKGLVKSNINSFTNSAQHLGQSLSIQDWLGQHKIFLRLFQFLSWGINHPIITLVGLLFLLALVWSIFKRIVYLVEMASWSIFQIPWKLCGKIFNSLWKTLFSSMGYFANLASQKITEKKVNDHISPIVTRIFPITYLNKQQRLTEISQRLKVIQKEQDNLLKEAANLIGSEKINVKFPEIK